MDMSEQNYFIKLVKQTLVAGIFGVLIMVLSMTGAFADLQTSELSWFWLIISLITLAIMKYSGGHFYLGAYNSFKNHVATMDTLVALGTGTAWLYSTAVVIIPNLIEPGGHHVYFESALIILALINLGSALETRARCKTSNAIQKLLQLQPPSARIVHGNQEMDIAVQEIKIDDILRIRPGENIPVDGVVIEGESYINEAMLTGESVPKFKTIGDKVSTGTTNTEGSLLMRAQAIGEKTVLAQIVSLVRQAQYTKPQIGKLTDKIAGIFVPVVLIIATLTALAWYNFGIAPIFPKLLTTTSAVLLIACPCALGLATPISIMASIGKGAEYGILVRNGEALQRAAELTTIVFDKTGTLTQGRPQVVKIYPGENHGREEILQIAASVERNSEHPWAQAIVQAAQNKNLSLIDTTKFTALPGKGVQAHIKGHLITIGNISLMHEKGVNVTLMQIVIDKCASRAYTPTFVARDQELIGILALADPAKPTAKKTITALKNSGVEIVLLTGDNIKTAHAVANELGIETVIAEILPEYKAQKILHLQQRGEVVGMVGDGINDAPALAQADVGFALGSGTDIAIASSDITLLGNDLNGVSNAMQLSKKTMRNIRQNLFGAFIYNTLSIPIAAGILFPWYGILLNPMIAAGAMAASSLTVVLNANRLRGIQFTKSTKQ